MGVSWQPMAGRLAWLALALAAMAGTPAAASAAVLVVAPGASRTSPPCTHDQPCGFLWALETTTSGVIQFRSGEYDLDGSLHNATLEAHAGVTLAPFPGEHTRPLIKQTVPFTECGGCATLTLAEDALLRELTVEQPTQALKEGAGVGALSIGPGAVVEQAVIAGADNGVRFNPAGSTVSELRNSLVTAGSGTAVEALDANANLDNVTAIARGVNGTALAARAEKAAATLEVTNTIARGEAADVRAGGATLHPASVELHYSDARTARELTGAEATIDDSEHPMHAEPTFISSTNFEQAPGSPTIDAGTADPRSGATDIESLPRTAGPAPDIGASEFQGLAPRATTGPAGYLTETSATISATLDSQDGAHATWAISYGQTKAYDQTTPAHGVASSFAVQPLTAILTGLTPGTVYHYRLVTSNDLGTTAGGDATFTTAVNPAALRSFTQFPGFSPFAQSSAPVDSALRLSHTRFRAASRGATIALARGPIGSRILYSDSQLASTTFEVLARVSGVRAGNACVAPSRHPLRGHRYTPCQRYLPRGSFAHGDHAGPNSLTFSGRLHSRRLPPGSYRLMATPRSAAGRVGATVSAAFTILP